MTDASKANVKVTINKNIKMVRVKSICFFLLCFVDDFFPNCNDTTWNHCVKEYNKRKRRYGH